MTIIFLVISLILLSYVLFKTTDYLVVGIKQVSKGTSLELYGITTLVVALATSLPELFVSVASSLAGTHTLPLGVILGSNISNMSLIIGGAAVISGIVKAKDSLFWHDIMYAFLIGCMPLLLLLDKSLSRIDGLILLVVYLIYSYVSLTGKGRKKLKSMEETHYKPKGIKRHFLQILGKKDVEQGMLRLTVGSFGMIISAELIVRLAQLIAQELSISLMLVGLFMISIGATIPELAFGIKTIARKEYMMAFGNLIGSIVVNSSLVLGITALIQPIPLDGDRQPYYISVIAFVVVYALFWLMTKSKRQLDRWEGAVLVGVYFLFAVAQLYL